MLQPDVAIDLNSSVEEVETKILEAKIAETQRQVDAAIRSTLEGIERMKVEFDGVDKQKAAILQRIEAEKKYAVEHYDHLLADLNAELVLRTKRLEAIREGNWDALSPDFGRPKSELHKFHDGDLVHPFVFHDIASKIRRSFEPSDLRFR